MESPSGPPESSVATWPTWEPDSSPPARVRPRMPIGTHSSQRGPMTSCSRAPSRGCRPVCSARPSSGPVWILTASMSRFRCPAPAPSMAPAPPTELRVAGPTCGAPATQSPVYSASDPLSNWSMRSRGPATSAVLRSSPKLRRLPLCIPLSLEGRAAHHFASTQPVRAPFGP